MHTHTHARMCMHMHAHTHTQKLVIYILAHAFKKLNHTISQQRL